MPDQNGNPLASDLDLSGIPGAEHLVTELAAPATPATDPGGSSEPPPSFAPNDGPEVDYTRFLPTKTEEPVAPVAPAAAPAGQQQQQEEQPPANPFTELLSKIPEPLHQEIQPMLDEYNRQITRRDESLEPYRPYIERGFNAQDIQLALQIQDKLLNDPHSFWQSLGNSYGWAQQAQPPAAGQIPGAPQQQQRGAFDDLFDPEPDAQGGAAAPLDPRVAGAIQRLAQETEGLSRQQADFQRQQQQAVARTQGRQAMEQEFAQIEQKYGQFDKDEVVKRAFANANAGMNPTLTHAFHELRDYERQVLQRNQQRPAAPTVMGSGSGLPPAAPPPKPTNDEERRAAALALAVSLGATPPGGTR